MSHPRTAEKRRVGRCALTKKDLGTKEFGSALASGEADLNGHFAAPLLLRLEAGDPIVILGGLHLGVLRIVRDEQDPAPSAT